MFSSLEMEEMRRKKTHIKKDKVVTVFFDDITHVYNNDHNHLHFTPPNLPISTPDLFSQVHVLFLSIDLTLNALRAVYICMSISIHQLEHG